MKKSITQNNLFSHIIGYASLIVCIAFFVFFSVAKADEITDNQSDLEEIANYLNNLKSFSADFTQEASDKKILKGKFYLSRPGKMRVEYFSQPKILIVVNGSILSYYDVELDEISRISTNSTPASFLTRENISFNDKDIELIAFKKTDQQIKVTVSKKNRKDAGEFSLIFSRNPLKFIKMEVKNDLDQVFLVTLDNEDFISKIPDKFFIIKNNDLP